MDENEIISLPVHSDIPMVRTACPHCGKAIRKSGLRTHQRSLWCKAMQSKAAIPTDMIEMSYEVRNTVYLLTDQWIPRSGTTQPYPLIKSYVTSYRRPGWGKSGRTHTNNFIHYKLVKILQSELPNDEKLICLYRDADSPEFNAAYAMAELLA
jgi:hypothetical protein